MNEGRVVYTKAGKIGRIVFDNRAAYNALTMKMWRELRDICHHVAKDEEVRVVTLRGAGGKAFISGTDIGEFLSLESGQGGVEYERAVDQCVASVEALPQATLAIVEGWAVGGGLAISFASDFRVATTDTKFGSPLGRTIGNCLSINGYARLVAHAGIAQAKRMLILGEMPTASELRDLGLVLDVLEPEALDARVDELCEKLVSMAPLTVSTSKEAMRQLMYRDLPNIENLIETVYGSEDFKMGVRNFLAKRETDWTGR